MRINLNDFINMNDSYTHLDVRRDMIGWVGYLTQEGKCGTPDPLHFNILFLSLCITIDADSSS
jgi:hypothetical protein